MLASATNYVREAVDARRMRGRKTAIAEVARALGFSERRVRAFVDGEVRQLLAEEWVALQERQRAEITARLASMEAQAAVLRARLAEASFP